MDDRANESVSRTFPDLPPGTYTVSETVPENWELTGITCTPEAAATITGTEVAITLAPEGAVTCTFNDLRIDPPPPPEPTPDPPLPGPTHRARLRRPRRRSHLPRLRRPPSFES